MHKLTRCNVAVVMVLSAATILAGSAPAQVAKFDSDTISGLGARNIGSAAMSGRVAALAAVKEDGRLTVYVGAASGGVWKSINGGTTFKPVFDKESAQSIGAVTIDPQAPKTIWVGTGEAWTRNSTSIGTGIYKSTDGGDSWKNMGLANSERIAKIIVDPKNGNTVYACVPGKLWSDSEDRGVYKTTDGGKSWNKILKGANLSTGCSMISMSPQDPKILFAGMWDFRRKGWTFRSGGESPTAVSGSGFFQSTDGGLTWNELDEKSAKGLPAKPWGRVAVTIAPSKPNVVYALIESTRSALFRSEDDGNTWEERDRSNWMVWRPFYFANLIVDPKNENKVYKPDLTLIMSEDGGKSFSGIGGGAHGDFHDVWVNPDNTDHLIAGDDGGVWYSYDGGNSWWKGNNLPISQFYHVSTDNADPYHVFGGLQDNSVWMGDSQYPGGISNGRWENLFGGDGFWVFPDPTDANYVYAEAQGGYVGRINRITLEARAIKPQPNYGEGKLRFNWNTPIHLSPNEKGAIYIGAQFLFRSRDHGQSWDRISPDLTTNDPEKQKQEESGGVTVDNSYAANRRATARPSGRGRMTGICSSGATAARLGTMSSAVFRPSRRIPGFPGWKPVATILRRRMRRLIATRLETWMRTFTRRRTTAKRGLRSSRRIAGCAGMHTSSRKTPFFRTCCSLERNSDFGSRRMAAGIGRSTRGTSFRMSRFATWSCIRANPILSWPRTAAGFGSWTTLLRCADSRPK